MQPSLDQQLIDFMYERLVSNHGHLQPSYLNAHQRLHDALNIALTKWAYNRTGGNQVKAARVLGINRNTVRKYEQMFKIGPATFRRD
jgi:DNA-binding NtrC family response regulator